MNPLLGILEIIPKSIQVRRLERNASLELNVGEPGSLPERSASPHSPSSRLIFQSRRSFIHGLSSGFAPFSIR